MTKNKKIAVYDLPIRIFHWLFAFLFLGAYIIAENIDDESVLFSYHIMAGLTIVFMLVLRIIWGVAGTTYARFSSFKLKPIELIQYFKDAIVKKTKRYLGHNPASSYAAIVMFISAFGLAITGILMSSGNGNDFYEETHELLANLFLITVIIHVGGIIYHHLKHKDSLWSSMLDGKKKSLPGASGINNMKTMTGIIFLVLTLSWMSYMYNQYDNKTQTLNLFGTELSLGEDH
ncbi:MAG: cytochrome b/b6 domain-containing protein [Candidatus Paceibacterota bacterium]